MTEWETRDPFAPRMWRWFAWYPVACEDGRTRWLTLVWRARHWRRWGLDTWPITAHFASDDYHEARDWLMLSGS